MAISAVATAATWDGDSLDNDLWSTGTNWADNTTPVTGADLIFDGEVQLINTNDLHTNFVAAVAGPPIIPAIPASILLNSITFAATAGEFSLVGNAIDLGAKTITNNSPNLQFIGAEIQIDAGLVGGLIVNTAVGDVQINKLSLRNGFNENLDKTGPGTLFLNGPLLSADTFAPRVQAGTLVATSSNNLFFNVNISAGATLRTGVGSANGVIHNGGSVTVNGTLDLAPGVNEDIGNLLGSGIVTNQGGDGAISKIMLRNGNTIPTTFSGSIQDGASGGRTSLQVGLFHSSATNSINTSANKLILSGANTYTGDTIIGQSSGKVSLELASTGSLVFKIGAAGVGTKIIGSYTQDTGTVALNGTFHIDVSEAEMVHNNQWLLVDATKLNESYGATFNVAAPFAKTAAGVWKYEDASLNIWTFTEADGKLLFQEPAGRPPVTTWDGGGTENNWATAANWDVEVLTGDELVFAGNTRLAPANDLDTAWDTVNSVPGAVTIDSITFHSSAGAFVVGGNAIDYAGRTITNNSPSTQTMDLQLQVDNGVGGLAVNTASGGVILNSLSLRNGFGADLVKTGAQTLFVNGPLGTTDTFDAVVNQGALEASSSGDLFFNGTIAAGTTLRTGGTSPTGVFHNGGTLTVNGTLELAQSVSEDISRLLGSGTVTNRGTGGTTSTVAIRSSASHIFPGSLADGASGGTTALQVGLTGGTETGTFTLSGNNSYSGNTVMGQTEASFALANTGTMKFKIGADTVNNRITAASPQVTGTVALDGTFLVDLSGASTTSGNSWTLVDKDNLNEAFGASFKIVNSAYIPPTSYTVNSGTGVFGFFAEDDSFATGGGNFANGQAISTTGVIDPAPVGVYQSERNGNFTYNFAGLGAGASYKVRLHFAEIFHGAAGLRVFDVFVNGALVLDNYDIYAKTGLKGQVIIEELTVPATLGGNISIQFVTGVDNAKVSGVEILPVGGGSGANFTQSADVWTMASEGNTWTFSEATGVLSIAAGVASNYSTWATANGIAGEPASGDFDKDGLTNLMEYALGKNPKVSSTPAGTYANGIVSFTKGSQAFANGDVAWSIEESDDLGVTDPWETVTPLLNDNSTISYQLPDGQPSAFVRLRVIGQ